METSNIITCSCGSTSFRVIEWINHDADINPETGVLEINSSSFNDNGTEEDVYCGNCGKVSQLSDFKEHEYIN